MPWHGSVRCVQGCAAPGFPQAWRRARGAPALPRRSPSAGSPDPSRHPSWENHPPPGDCWGKPPAGWRENVPSSRAAGAVRVFPSQDRDVREGADVLMVKPGMPYLDLVRDVKARVSSPGAG